MPIGLAALRGAARAAADYIDSRRPDPQFKHAVGYWKYDLSICRFLGFRCSGGPGEFVYCSSTDLNKVSDTHNWNFVQAEVSKAEETLQKLWDDNYKGVRDASMNCCTGKDESRTANIFFKYLMENWCEPTNAILATNTNGEYFVDALVKKELGKRDRRFNRKVTFMATIRLFKRSTPGNTPRMMQSPPPVQAQPQPVMMMQSPPPVQLQAQPVMMIQSPPPVQAQPIIMQSPPPVQAQPQSQTVYVVQQPQQVGSQV